MLEEIAQRIRILLPVLKATDKDLGLRTYFLYVLLAQHASSGLPLPLPEGIKTRIVAADKFNFPDAFNEMFN